MIVSFILVGAILGFMYIRQGNNTPADNTAGTNFIARFNPFATSKPTTPTTTPPTTENPNNTVTPEENISKEKLQKISSMPVAGFGIFTQERLKEIPIIPPTTDTANTTNPITPPVKKSVSKKPTPPPTEFMPAVRYVEKKEGIIYQTFLDKIGEKKFSATVIPKIYEAYLGNKNMSVVMRYLKINEKTIETFVGTLPKEILGGDTTMVNEVKGSFLPDNITDVSLSPDTTKMFYLFNVGDSAVGTIINLADNKKTQIFDSSFTEWLSSWPNTNLITLTTKPSWNTLGYMYILNPSTKSLTKMLGDIKGLTTLTSPDGKSILYANNTLALNIYNSTKKSNIGLGIKTLPEKCVWNKKSDAVYCAVPKVSERIDYPDTWYQGETSFSDQIWKINIENGNTTLLVDPIEVVGGEEIDGTKLSVDENENYLLFVNKKDSYLWKLDLK